MTWSWKNTAQYILEIFFFIYKRGELSKGVDVGFSFEQNILDK